MTSTVLVSWPPTGTIVGAGSCCPSSSVPRPDDSETPETLRPWDSLEAACSERSTSRSPLLATSRVSSVRRRAAHRRAPHPERRLRWRRRPTASDATSVSPKRRRRERGLPPPATPCGRRRAAAGRNPSGRQAPFRASARRRPVTPTQASVGTDRCARLGLSWNLGTSEPRNHRNPGTPEPLEPLSSPDQFADVIRRRPERNVLRAQRAIGQVTKRVRIVVDAS